MDFRSVIRDVPDFPKPGIIFKDITTLLKDATAFHAFLDEMAALFRDMKIDKVAGAESRGFIVGAPLAYLLGAGFIPIRKKGKLPAETVSAGYALEYGSAEIEIHRDAITAGERVLLVDDVLATGGTAAAMASLVRKLGGIPVAFGFLMELGFLEGRKKLDIPVRSLITY